MSSLPESQFLSAGYYLARPSNRGPHTSARLIPARLISASTCICEFFPDAWTIQWISSVDQKERERSAAAFRLKPDEIDRIMQWATSSFQKQFGWPNTFYTLEEAFAARSEFLARDLDMAVFGLGLHCDHSEEFSAGQGLRSKGQVTHH